LQILEENISYLLILFHKKEQFGFYQSLRHAISTNFEANQGQYDGSETETDLDSATNITTCDLSARRESYFCSPYWGSTTDSDTFLDSGKGKLNRMNNCRVNQSETDIDENIIVTIKRLTYNRKAAKHLCRVWRGFQLLKICEKTFQEASFDENKPKNT
jgi:hypothetical protein